MGQARLIGGIVMVSLFAIALTTYAINFASDNNAQVTIADDSDLSNLRTGLITDVNTQNTTSSSISVGFGNATIDTGDDNIRTGSPFKDSIVTPTRSVGRVLSAVRNTIFGGSSAFGIILTSLSAFLVLLGILYVWKTWKGGNPD